MPKTKPATATPSSHADNSAARDASEPVWKFRGYEMRPAEFNTAMVHYYRAEIQRSNVWRQRLDNTTNWAVITAGAGISFSLSDPSHHYAAIILNTLLVTIFLWIEARRYRYYELWAHRTRLMETDFFGNMLVPPFAPRPNWAEDLSESLQTPEYPISMWEAFGRRFRRNYMWIYLVLGLAWVFKCVIHPHPTYSFEEFIARLALGPLSGRFIFIAGLVFNGILFIIGLGTAGLQQASGEVLPRSGEIPILSRIWEALEVKDAAAQGAAIRRDFARIWRRRRQQLLCIIISSQPQAVAQKIMTELKRGVTGLHGQGMHAQQEREVLVVATTVNEVKALKAAVRAEDPRAFVIVMPAQEVLGHGFQPLEA